MIKVVVQQRYPVPVQVYPQNGIQVKAYQAGPPGVAGPGVPAGGTAGQVLKKIDGTNYNTAWQNEAGASPVVGLSQVAFGDPSTGVLTSNNRFIVSPDSGTQFKMVPRGDVNETVFAIGDYIYFKTQVNPGFPDRTQFYAAGVSITNSVNDPYISAQNITLSFATTYYLFTHGAEKHFVGNNYQTLKSGGVATDYGVRIDQSGVKIGQLSALGSANTNVFTVENFFSVNSGVGFGITLFNPSYGGHFLNIKFDTFNSIYQQYYGDTIFKSDSYNGGLGQLTLKQTGETEIRYNGTVKASLTTYPTFYNNANFPLYWYENGGINYLTWSDTGNPSIARGLMLTNGYTALSAPVGAAIYAFIGANAKLSITNDDTYIANTTTLGKKLNLAASVVAFASLNIPVGVAPTTPVNGDIWFDGADLKMRIAGSTKVFFDVVNETPSGLINGSNATFTTAFNFDPGTEEVYLNGLKLVKLEDYNTTGTNQIDLYVSPGAGEHLIVNYKKI